MTLAHLLLRLPEQAAYLRLHCRFDFTRPDVKRLCLVRAKPGLAAADVLLYVGYIKRSRRLGRAPGAPEFTREG